MLKSLKSFVGVHYTVSVIEAGREVFHLPRKRNLLTDSGLDIAATSSWANCFRYAVVGTGTDPVKRASGVVTVSRAGTAIVSSAGFFEAGDVGRLFKFDSGEECYLDGFTDSQHVSSAVAGTVAASPGTVWYVNRTGLQTESKRTSTCANDAGDNGISLSVNTWTLKRTFVFSAESGSVTYNEIGWSNTGSAGANLFGQDLISGGVALSSGQQLKVVVELSITFSPHTVTAYSNVVTGWTQNGNCIIERFNSICSIAANGDNGSTAGALDPATTPTIGVATDATALVTSGAGYAVAGATGGTTTMLSYVAGSRKTIVRGAFSILQANGNIRSIYLQAPGGGSDESAFRVLLDANETKDSDHTLTIEFSRSWDRVLTN